MLLLLWSILVLGSLDVISVINAATKDKEMLADYNGVVLNMIRSWESPVVYLRDRGFLPSDYRDTSKIKPSLDALMQRLERDKRKAQNSRGEGMQPQKIEDVRATKQKKSIGWEQLQIISRKLAGLKGKSDDQVGRDKQLMAMKRRLEQIGPFANYTSQQQKFQGNVNHASAQSYDEILQRMIEKTSPYSRRQHFHGAYPTAYSNSIHGVLGAKANNPPTSVPISLSTQLGDPEGKTEKASCNLKPGLPAPTFMTWDMKNGRLNYSHSENEAYLNKLLSNFGQRLDFKETHPSESPKCTQIFKNSMGHSPFGVHACPH